MSYDACLLHSYVLTHKRNIGQMPNVTDHKSWIQDLPVDPNTIFPALFFEVGGTSKLEMVIH